MSNERLSDEDLNSEIRNKVANLSNRGLLPNAIWPLVVSSAKDRRMKLFADKMDVAGISGGGDVYELQWEEWVNSYDPFSGENLAATALFQHGEYTPNDSRFPQEGSPEYDKLEEEMANLGLYLKDLFDRDGWGGMGDYLRGLNMEL